MKFLSVFFTFLIFTISCNSSKKLQSRPASDTITTAITTKKDTAIAANTSTEKVDTGKVRTDVYNEILNTRINFTTFNARARIGYNGSQGNGDATAIIRMKKDSIIWISLRGPLGIEGFRMMVSRDSVVLMDLLKKNVQYRPVGFLQQVTGIPFDLSTLQDLIIGNPVFIDSNIVSSQINANELVLTMQGKILKNLLSVNNTDFQVLHSHLENSQSLNCDITYNEYKKGTEGNFSTERSISVNNAQQQQSKMDIKLEFKQYDFNQPVTFPFSVSSNYKKL